MHTNVLSVSVVKGTRSSLCCRDGGGTQTFLSGQLSSMSLWFSFSWLFHDQSLLLQQHWTRPSSPQADAAQQGLALVNAVVL